MRFTNSGGFDAIQKNVTSSGTPVKLSGYYVATTISFSDANPDTILDSASNFLKMGFQAGDKIVITGTTNNNKTVEVSTVAAGTITLVTGQELTTEAAGASVTLDTVRGIPVQDGVECTFKAKAGNTGTITLGPTSAKALNTNTSYFSNYRMTAGQSIVLQIKNLSSVWMDATVSGEGIEIILEA